MHKLMTGLLTCLALVLAGCHSGGSDDQFAKDNAVASDSSAVAESTDTGNTDTGNTDTGNTDTGNTDTGNTDVLSVIATEGCPANMTCGFMKAPKNYDMPDGEMVDIFYGVHKAEEPGRRIGALVFNFGGPSAEAVWGAASMAASHLPQDILNRFDIVGIDPRGAGLSAFAKELTLCAVAEHNKKGTCDQTYREVAPYLGSNTIIKDIDRLRRLLGDEKLTFLGYSYGTRLGSLYAYNFPDKVRAIVLDSPMSPTDANNIEIRTGNARGYEKIAGFRLDYANHISRKDRYQTIVDNLFTYPNYQYTANDGFLSLKEGASVLNLTVSRERSGHWHNIKPGLINLLENDSVSSLKRQIVPKSKSFSSLSYSNSKDALRGKALFKAVVCTDERKPLTDDEIDTSVFRYIASSSLYGKLTYLQTAKLCKGWLALRDPVPAVTDMAARLGDKRVLIIGGQYDPATPYIWAKEMSANFDKAASLLTVNNYVDHAVSYTGIDCIDQRTTAYLLEPESEIEDQSCDVPSPAFSQSFERTLRDPHPAKDVIGW